MARPELKLVVARAGGRAGGTAAAWGGLVLAAGIAATLAGADAARAPFDPEALAEAALRANLSSGDPLDVPIRALRARLTLRPLDAETRAVYSGLLREAAEGPDDLAAARFHASRAAATAPVTIPVVAAAASTLARAGGADEAAALARAMFAYAPRSAAGLLARLEPFLGEKATASALPDDPQAWLAWARTLRAERRADEAEERLEAAWRRWPRRADVLVARAEGPFWRDDAAALAAIVPSGMPIPDVPEAPWLHAFRARVRAEAGDVAGAKADAARAVAAAPGAHGVLEAAARAVESAGDADTAASYLRRARFALPHDAPRAARERVLVSLARLADRSGSGAESLRAWRLVLEVSPEHAEARRRVEALTAPLVIPAPRG